jgi:hypothetical protein
MFKIKKSGYVYSRSKTDNASFAIKDAGGDRFVVEHTGKDKK